MRRGVGVVFLVLCGVVMAGSAQDATLTMWTFPEPDRGASDLKVADDGRIYLAFYEGMAIGRFDPTDDTLVEWAVEEAPDSLVLTEYGIFYALPRKSALGFLDPDRAYTLEWRTPKADPRSLVMSSSGPGLVNLYLAERAFGRIVAFEPATIAFRSLAGVDRVPVTLDAVTKSVTPATATATVEGYTAPDGGAPAVTELTELEEGPFREWCVDLGGMDLSIDDIAVGGDGGIWYAQGLAAAVGVVVPWDGLGMVYPLPDGSDVAAVAASPDESIWFADIVGRCHLGRLDPETGDVALWEIPLDARQPFSFVFDDAGGVWFSDREADAIFCLDSATGALRRWLLPAGTHPLTLGASEPGTFWFVSEGLNALGRLVVP